MNAISGAFGHAGSIAFSASNCSRTAKSNILNMSNVEGLGAIRDDDTKKFPRCSRVLAGLGELRKHRPYVRHFDPIDFVC
jgi:hypothetical protein